MHASSILSDDIYIEVDKKKILIRNIDELTLFAMALHQKVAGSHNPKLIRFTSDAYKTSPLQNLYKQLLQSLNNEQLTKIAINIVEQLSQPASFYKFIHHLFALIQLFRIINSFYTLHFITALSRVDFFDKIINLILLDNHILKFIDDSTKLNDFVSHVIDKNLDLEYILKIYTKIIETDFIYKKIIMHYEDFMVAKEALKKPMNQINMPVNTSTQIQYWKELPNKFTENKFTEMQSRILQKYYSYMDADSIKKYIENTSATDLLSILDTAINSANNSLNSSINYSVNNSTDNSLELSKSKTSLSSSLNDKNMKFTLLPPVDEKKQQTKSEENTNFLDDFTIVEIKK